MASWLDGGSSSKIAGLALNTAVAGEPLEVLVSITNPLALDLSVSRMRLAFEAEPGGSTEAAAALAEAAASEAAPEAFAEVTCLVCQHLIILRTRHVSAQCLAEGRIPLAIQWLMKCLGTCGRLRWHLCVQVEESAVTLKPHESAWVALRLRPLRPGLLTLTGVDWILNGTAPGHKQFALRPPQNHRRTASK